MRRLAAHVLVGALACVLLVGGRAAARSALRCSNPTVQTGYEDGIAFPGGYRTNVDGWTHTGSYRMSVCGPDDWTVIAKQSTGLKQVRAYPDSERTWTDWSTCASQPPISSFTKLKNTYAFRLPDAGSWDATTDVFLDGGICNKPIAEVMILHQWRNVGFPTPQDVNVTIAGAVYNVYHAAGFVQLYQATRTSRGTFDLLSVLAWCQSKGYVPLAATGVFDREGIEVLSTNGNRVAFHLTNFNVAEARR